MCKSRGNPIDCPIVLPTVEDLIFILNLASHPIVDFAPLHNNSGSGSYATLRYGIRDQKKCLKEEQVLMRLGITERFVGDLPNSKL